MSDPTHPPDAGLSRAPFSRPAAAITKLNDSLETPLIKLLGKGVWIMILGLIGIALYAGRAKLQEEISQNTVIIENRRRLLQVEQVTVDNAATLGQLKQTDGQVANVLEKVVTQQQQMTTQLAVVGEQIRQGAATSDKLERTVNRLSERLPARPGN